MSSSVAAAAAASSSIHSFLRHDRKDAAAANVALDDSRIKLVAGKVEKVKEGGNGGVLYWMSRDKRVQDNWAMLHAQKVAKEAKAELHVAFCMPMETTRRRMHFMVEGLKVKKRSRWRDVWGGGGQVQGNMESVK